jgi:membrane-associated phospholipid phosphatase
MQATDLALAARLVIAAGVMLAFNGCATLPSGGEWGAEVRKAAKDAARDPWVWAPLAGAAALQVEGFDLRVSDWARDHTPVFGSRTSAEDWSDDLRSATLALTIGTLIATQSGDTPRARAVRKLERAATESLAIGATWAATGGLKSAAGRERPNGFDRDSFPSGHASSAAVYGRLAALNLDAIEVDARVERAARWGIDVMVIGTGWARVESGWHYPSDSLGGIALGNFLSSFVTRVFLPMQGRSSVSLMPADGGVALQWGINF